MKTYTFDVVAEWDDGKPMSVRSLCKSLGLMREDFKIKFVDIGNCFEANITPKNLFADIVLRKTLHENEVYYDVD